MENKPCCKLVGIDGNVFAIIGNVSKCLRRAGLQSEAAEFFRRAMQQESYDNILQLCHEYVDVR